MLTDFRPFIEKNQVYVIEENKSIVGVMLMIKKDNHMYVGNLAVIPEHQGKGLGYMLMKYAEEKALENDLKEIRLYTNEKLTELQVYYSKLGYIETQRKIHGGYNRVFMSKFLK